MDTGMEAMGPNTYFSRVWAHSRSRMLRPREADFGLLLVNFEVTSAGDWNRLPIEFYCAYWLPEEEVI